MILLGDRDTEGSLLLGLLHVQRYRRVVNVRVSVWGGAGDEHLSVADIRDSVYYWFLDWGDEGVVVVAGWDCWGLAIRGGMRS